MPHPYSLVCGFVSRFKSAPFDLKRSVNRVTTSRTWSTIPPTYSSNFVDRWIALSNPPNPFSPFCTFAMSKVSFCLGTDLGFRYKYRVASAGILDAHDPKGKNICGWLLVFLDEF